MSMYLEFTPHSWYYGFAIDKQLHHGDNDRTVVKWKAYIDNGNTYRIDTVEAHSLAELKLKIRKYRGIE